MTDTQMSWLHILVKDRGSTFIVILKTFMQGKFSAFLYCQVPVKKWKEGVICCCKHYRTQLVKNCTPN